MLNHSASHRPRYQQRYDEIERNLGEFEKHIRPLPGIVGAIERNVLINQLIDSERRNRHFEHMLNRQASAQTADPHVDNFDPIRAAIYHRREGNFDEAIWLVFQFIHFGKHPITGWRYVKEVYGRLDRYPLWSWEEISSNTPEFRLWLGENQVELRRRDQPRGFGNHRKYASLSHESARGTASVFESYVEWVMGHGSHAGLFNAYSGGSVHDQFEALYRAMDVVMDFGRIAKFDYLMTLSRLQFLPIAPGHTYLKDATGPLFGARLLVEGFGSVAKARELEKIFVDFADIVGVTPDVIEDAICNWQKSPAKFKPFVL